MSNVIPVIAIDGPSGSGKGTISQMVAKKLGWRLLDSGALYRVLALAAKQHAVKYDNEKALEVLAGHLDVQFIAQDDMTTQIILEGEDVTQSIRIGEIGNAASIVGALPTVREALLERQRAFREAPGLVADGRDMGTVVFKDAQLKIFLVASLEERAQRRFKQLKQLGRDVNIDRILSQLVERDIRDKDRPVAPLRPADDSVMIDTTGLSIKEVLSKILNEAEKRFGELVGPE